MSDYDKSQGSTNYQTSEVPDRPTGLVVDCKTVRGWIPVMANRALLLISDESISELENICKSKVEEWEEFMIEEDLIEEDGMTQFTHSHDSFNIIWAI